MVIDLIEGFREVKRTNVYSITRINKIVNNITCIYSMCISSAYSKALHNIGVIAIPLKSSYTSLSANVLRPRDRYYIATFKATGDVLGTECIAVI